MALRPLEIDRPPDESGGRGYTVASRTTQKAEQLGKHVYKRTKTPLKWRIRRWQNVWYAYVKPDLRRRYRALQSLTRQNNLSNWEMKKKLVIFATWESLILLIRGRDGRPIQNLPKQTVIPS